MSQWTWNNVELEIDMEDADFQEKYEDAFKQMEVEEQELKNVGKLSDITRAYCEMFYKLFDNIFGTGTAEKLFDGKKNAGVIDECYDSFITMCKRDVTALNKKRAARTAKYNLKVKK